MKFVTSAQMRELDRRTIEELGTPGEILMDRAGSGIAEQVHLYSSLRSHLTLSVLLVAGRGNNGTSDSSLKYGWPVKSNKFAETHARIWIGCWPMASLCAKWQLLRIGTRPVEHKYARR